jgi:hypothetical protein
MKGVKSVECETCGFKTDVSAATPEWECCPKCGAHEKIYELDLWDYDMYKQVLELVKKIRPPHTGISLRSIRTRESRTSN